MTLNDLILSEISLPVHTDVTALAVAVAARHPGSTAVIFYGAALREDLHCLPAGSLIDLYLLVEDYETAFNSFWLAAANRLLPPNVFPFTDGVRHAKYAVLTLDDFRRLCSPAADNVSLFARMAQPVRLVWTSHAEVAPIVAEGVASAVRTLLTAARPMIEDAADALALWRRALTLTYGCELRAERAGRAGLIIGTQADRCMRLAAAAGQDNTLQPAATYERRTAEARWRRWRYRGKLLSVARLMKATFTYSGGIDYIADKISRHSGTSIEVKPWMRSHPIAAGLWLAPRLWWRAAIR